MFAIDSHSMTPLTHKGGLRIYGGGFCLGYSADAPRQGYCCITDYSLLSMSTRNLLTTLTGISKVSLFRLFTCLETGMHPTTTSSSNEMLTVIKSWAEPAKVDIINCIPNATMDFLVSSMAAAWMLLSIWNFPKVCFSVSIPSSVEGHSLPNWSSGRL